MINKDEIKKAVIKRDAYRCRCCGVHNGVKAIYTTRKKPIELDAFTLKWAKSEGKKIYNISLNCTALPIWVEPRFLSDFISLCNVCQLKYNRLRSKIIKSKLNGLIQKDKEFRLPKCTVNETIIREIMIEIANVFFDKRINQETTNEIIKKIKNQ